MPDQESYPLLGLHNPIGRRPAFLTPVFGYSLQSNQLYVHRLDEKGRVEGFEEFSIKGEDLEFTFPDPDREFFGVGEEAWWAFALPDADGGIVQGRETTFKALLAQRADAPGLIASPLVRLEVLSFLDDRQRLPDALRRVFDILRERSPRSAAMWQNNQALLKPARNALRALVPPERRTPDFVEAVDDTEMRVEQDTPNLRMAQSLYEYCTRRSQVLRRALERADFQAQALGLNPVAVLNKGGPSGLLMDTADAPADAPAPTRRGTGKSQLSLLRDVVKGLEDDIRRQLDGDPALNAPLDREWTDAREVGRTATGFQEWREGEITQAAVHWVLSAVFVRFLEDNRLIDDIWLSGPTAERREAARGRHQDFVRRNPSLSDREYLLDAFQTLAGMPGLGPLFDPRHNPVWRLQPTGDGAAALIDFFQKVDAASGALLFDLTRPDLNTRFLGNLYQDLSEATRARYALLQTPEFVEEFILDRTLEPAVREYGLPGFRIIDPTCGSGHFLLGAFRRLLEHWRIEDPNVPPCAWVQRALGSVNGVDLNPFAVAIARFRLLIAALAASGIRRLEDAPDFPLNLAIGDSLLHGRHFGQMDLGVQLDDTDHAKTLRHVYHAEDADTLARILGQQYHAVVGNPPYITVKDKALNQAYRERFSSCDRAYALSVPFIERFFDLAMDGRFQLMRLTKADGTESLVRPGVSLEKGDSVGLSYLSITGHIGLIVSNSFMKREFGKKLIESVLPQFDLTDIVDTSGAYIPGHGTPTCILFGRNRAPLGETIKALLGKKREPGKPADPAHGQVWTAVLDQIDMVPSESDFITAAVFPRTAYARHPWSIGGGGAIELKDHMERVAKTRLKDLVEDIGFGAVTREDDAYFIGKSAAKRKKIGEKYTLPVINGKNVRDYAVSDCDLGIFPYAETLEPYLEANVLKHLWPYRTQLSNRVVYGKSQIDRGLSWYEYSMLFKNRFTAIEPICFPFVSSGNHFSTQWDKAVFNRTAPMIIIRETPGNGVRRELLSLLNSSLACFWMKQSFQNRGSTVDNLGSRQKTALFEDFYEYTVSGIGSIPIPEKLDKHIAGLIDSKMKNFSKFMEKVSKFESAPSRLDMDILKQDAMQSLKTSISMQEELDWLIYMSFGIADTPDFIEVKRPIIKLGERAFEIVLARKMAAGEVETTWFERHGSTPITELPKDWPEDYKRIVERRIELIETDRFINLVERPEYKRRWAMEPWEEMEKKALKSWLLERLEDDRYWSHGAIITLAQLADMAMADPEFLQVAKLYERRDDFDISVLIATLALPESVPYLPVLRYTDSGLRKREEWEKTWEKQRREDEIDAESDASWDHYLELTANEYERRNSRLDGTNDLTEEALRRMVDSKIRELKKRQKDKQVGTILPPPKYRSADFQRADYWRLRGGLDVAKERFISYPDAAKNSDGTLAIAWAGWDHLQQARALSAHYLTLKEQEGWPADRLAPLLLGLLDLVPWLRQWHNDVDPAFGARMGDYFDDFVTGEARDLSLTLETLRGWTPSAAAKGRGRKKG